MSGDLPLSTGFDRSRFFRPGTFLAGLLGGLLLCSFAARTLSRRGYHEAFTRFHQVISPEAQYYPTLAEMCGIARSRCRPDQVLVIVGGNSVFLGVGQPAQKMWTVELQRLLGERFVVLNFAFRGALCTDGGAVVAEALRGEFPRQVYVANALPFGLPYAYGQDPYRYLFWEAFDGGRLEDFAPRVRLMDHPYPGFDSTWGGRFEIWGRDWLDRGLRFRDLWNWVGYEHLFTIPNPITPHLPQAVWARKRFQDQEPDFEAMAFAAKFRPENLEAEMNIVRGFSDSYYVRDPAGGWRLRDSVRKDYEWVLESAVPDDLKGRTLIMLSRNNPYYVRRLAAAELERENDAYRDALSVWRKAGYSAWDYGSDFDVGDFGDRTHLSATGGRKLAGMVAGRVLEIAGRRGYLKGEGSVR